MDTRITKEQARAYAARWEAVRQRERRELQAKTPTQKFAEVEALMRAAREFGWMETLAKDDLEEHLLWAQIRKRMRG